MFGINLVMFLLLAISSIEARKKLNRDSENTPEYFDLGYSFNKDTIYFPGHKEFTLNKDYDGVNKSGIWYSAYSFCMGEHGGTHVDAPFHFNKEGWTLDKIPPSRMIDVPTAVIDVETEVNSEKSPSEFIIEVRHLIEYEKKGKEVPFGGVVLFHTGWSKYWPDKIKYLGWDNTTATDEGKAFTNFPGLSLEAAKWLTDERQIVGLGIDTPSVDVGSSKTFPVHVLHGEKQIYNIENVANLHTIISKSDCELHLYVMPLKIIGATGGPARILAYCK